MKTAKRDEFENKDINQIVNQVSEKRECERCLGEFVRWGNNSNYPNRPPVTEEVKAKLEAFLKSHYVPKGGTFHQSEVYYQYLESLCDECLYSTMWDKQKEEREEREEREMEEREKRERAYNENLEYDDNDDEYNQWPGIDPCDYRGG